MIDEQKYIDIYPQSEEAKKYPFNLFRDAFPRINWDSTEPLHIPADYKIALNYVLHLLTIKSPQSSRILMQRYRDGKSDIDASDRHTERLCHRLLWQLSECPGRFGNHSRDLPGFVQWAISWKAKAMEDKSYNPAPVSFNHGAPGCLVVSNSETSAKNFLDMLPSVKQQYSLVECLPIMGDGHNNLQEHLAKNTGFNTIYIWGGLNEKEAAAMLDQLIRVPIRIDSKHPLIDYIPKEDVWEPGTAIRLTRKEYYWLVKKIDVENNRVIC